MDQLKIHVTLLRNELAQELLNQEAGSKKMLSVHGLQLQHCSADEGNDLMI